MKKFIAFSIVLTAIFFASCKKETLPSPSPVTPRPINIEYRVFGETGHLAISYTAFDNGTVTHPSMQVDRTNFSYSFNWTTNEPLSVSASNATPSGKEVRVEIYVDGVLFKSGLANAPNATATAEGTAY
jgi:hypothetical protein